MPGSTLLETADSVKKYGSTVSSVVKTGGNVAKSVRSLGGDEAKVGEAAHSLLLTTRVRYGKVVEALHCCLQVNLTGMMPNLLQALEIRTRSRNKLICCWKSTELECNLQTRHIDSTEATSIFNDRATELYNFTRHVYVKKIFYWELFLPKLLYRLFCWAEDYSQDRRNIYEVILSLIEAAPYNVFSLLERNPCHYSAAVCYRLELKAILDNTKITLQNQLNKVEPHDFSGQVVTIIENFRTVSMKSKELLLDIFCVYFSLIKKSRVSRKKKSNALFYENDLIDPMEYFDEKLKRIGSISDKQRFNLARLVYMGYALGKLFAEFVKYRIDGIHATNLSNDAIRTFADRVKDFFEVYNSTKDGVFLMNNYGALFKQCETLILLSISSDFMSTLFDAIHRHRIYESHWTEAIYLSLLEQVKRLLQDLRVFSVVHDNQRLANFNTPMVKISQKMLLNIRNTVSDLIGACSPRPKLSALGDVRDFQYLKLFKRTVRFDYFKLTDLEIASSIADSLRFLGGSVGAKSVADPVNLSVGYYIKDQYEVYSELSRRMVDAFLDAVKVYSGDEDYIITADTDADELETCSRITAMIDKKKRYLGTEFHRKVVRHIVELLRFKSRQNRRMSQYPKKVRVIEDYVDVQEEKQEEKQEEITIERPARASMTNMRHSPARAGRRFSSPFHHTSSLPDMHVYSFPVDNSGVVNVPCVTSSTTVQPLEVDTMIRMAQQLYTHFITKINKRRAAYWFWQRPGKRSFSFLLLARLIRNNVFLASKKYPGHRAEDIALGYLKKDPTYVKHSFFDINLATYPERRYTDHGVGRQFSIGH